MPSPVGRDSMRERFTPRVVNSARICPRAPGRSSGSGTTSVVLSAPVGAGRAVGRESSTKRVTAPGTSSIRSASTGSPVCSATSGAHTAASKSPWATRPAPAAVDGAGVNSTPGSAVSAQPRTCAQAWGCVVTRRTSSIATPGRPTSTKLMGTCTSARICSVSPRAISSTVAETPPSTEFSMGTTARSTSPLRSAATALSTEPADTNSASAGSATLRRAASVKVPAGPRKA